MAVRIIVLVLYFAVLLAIGVYTSKMAKTYSEYNLAARSNNKWIAGLYPSHHLPQGGCCLQCRDWHLHTGLALSGP